MAKPKRGAGVRDVCDVTIIHLTGVKQAQKALPTSDRVQDLADLLALLGNTTRLKILLALQPAIHGPRIELCVCDLAHVAGASKSMTSHQLRLLRTAGLLAQRRAGKLAFYRLADGAFADLLLTMAKQEGTQKGASRARDGRSVVPPREKRVGKLCTSPNASPWAHPRGPSGCSALRAGHRRQPASYARALRDHRGLASCCPLPDSSRVALTGGSRWRWFWLASPPARRPLRPWR